VIIAYKIIAGDINLNISSPFIFDVNETLKSMTLIKHVFKIFSVATLLLTTSVVAGDFLVDTTIYDTPNDYVYGGASRYGIDKMDVQWADNGLITVDVYTNFVNYNARTYAGGEKIVFGDLLISTAGTSDFDYAFSLSEGRNDKYKNHHWYKTKTWNNEGKLIEVDSTTTSDQYHNGSDNIGHGDVITAGDAVADGNWSVDNYGEWTGVTDKLSFSFNVTGIDAFQDASQLAFSWAMSCANDIIHGVVNVDRPQTNSIPEPTTFLLVLLALGLMAKRRHKKINHFSA